MDQRKPGREIFYEYGLWNGISPKTENVNDG